MAAKRKFNEQDMDGKIVRLKLKDFLTYDNCEFQPGEKLNVILGPNGTGKSSIVCAICLGLGGKPSLLGRAKEIHDYVKHRKKEAVIEIELSKKDGPNLIIRRTLKKGSNVSKFEMNGKISSWAAVTETVAKMNIQMENLCQFLPQDRVAEFAKMDPQQLLVATEKAVGPVGMYEDHKNLIQLRAKYKETEAQSNEKRAHKERIESYNQRLERDVKRYKERESHQQKIELLQKKRPWAEYEEAREETMLAKEAKKEIEKKIKELRKQNNPVKEKLEKVKAEVIKTENDIKALCTEGTKNGQKIKKIEEEMLSEFDKIAELRQDFDVLKAEELNRNKRVDKLEKEIESLNKDFQKAPDPEELKPKNEELANEIKAIQHQLNELNKQKTDFLTDSNNLRSQIEGVKRKLREVENVDNQKLETLRRIDRQTYDAVLWLRNNKSMFSGTVYEPIVTQISMGDMRNAMYLETIISYNDMKAFVCENRQDQKLFSNQTRENLKLNVSAVCPPADARDVYHPQQPLEEYKKYGFHNYVTDLFTAPKTVLQYLCESYNLHNIPIGDENIERKPEEVIDNTSLRRFFTPSSIYTVTRSKYANKKSTSVSGVRKDARMLNPSVDLEVKKQLDTELSQLQARLKTNATKCDAINKNIERLAKQQEELRQEKTKIISQMKRRQMLSSQIETKVKRLEQEKKVGPDMEKAEQQMKNKIDKLNKVRLNFVHEYKDLVQKSIRIGTEHLESNLRRVEDKHRFDILDGKFQTFNSELSSMEEKLASVSRGYTEARNRAHRLIEEAKRVTGGTADELIPKDIQKVFDTLPSSVAEIDAMIYEQKTRLDCQFETNPLVVKDYDKNTKEIARLERELSKTDEQVQEIQKNIEELLERWLRPLQQLIARINEQYSDFFRRMGCAGQVVLKQDPMDDYSKYGVQISVKFRAENKLKELTSFFQSGGERSVSTMLYLISLQELTKCPFRLVDEINQGMDANNERRVFELVVETVCRPNTSQYFLITPKLLPDLHYNDKMTVLTVLNGHWMVPHEKFRLKEIIERRRRLIQV